MFGDNFSAFAVFGRYMTKFLFFYVEFKHVGYFGIFSVHTWPVCYVFTRDIINLWL